ncbi:MAG: hypothetical protein A2020_15925 [Lentisphaerae bacterium GWF2_45_14]|nr:MAG: hypothetical protein A2020_15925 [Lentisphaerae bacterium GWF2_45_14]
MTTMPGEFSFRLKPYRIALLLFSASLLLFLIGLNECNFVRLSCRFGIFAKEMVASGGLHIFPTLYGEPYPDYPSTFTFLTVLASRLPGGVTLLSCAFPSAAAAALTLVLIYFTGALYSKELGIRALLITIGTYGFAAAARAPVPDHFVALFAVAAFYFTVRPLLFNSSKLLWLIVPLCLIGGFIFRGPLGAVLPGAVVFSVLVVERRWKLIFLFGAVSAFVLALCVGGLLYLAYCEGGDKLVKSVVDAQFSGRFSKAKPFYYYFTSGAGIYFLSFISAIAAVAVNWKKMWDKNSDELSIRLLRLFAAWALIILVGLSIPGTKHARYLLPMVPALSLAGAFIFEAPAATRAISGILIFLRFLPFIILALGFSALAVFSIFKIPFGFPVVAFAGSFLILCYAAIFTVKRQSSAGAADFIKLAVGVFSVLFLQITVIEPVEQSMEDSAPFVRSVERVRYGRNLVFYDMGPDGDELKYLVNLEKTFRPEFIYKPGDILKQKDSVIIIRTKDYKKLSAEIRDNLILLSEGRVGSKTSFALIPAPQSPAKPSAAESL